MQLKVYGKASTIQRKDCRIKVDYDETQGLTIVIVDCDIVTLGTAVEVLTQQYNEVLEAFAPTAQEQIRNTIKEAVNRAVY
mgnify:CR=1 FL=1